jgi:PAS domain S-box-containing protein
MAEATTRRSDAPPTGGDVARTRALLRLLARVAESSNAASALGEALRVVLPEVCERTGWEFGHAFVLADDASGDLVSSGVSYAKPAHRFEPLRRATETARYAREDPLRKLVLATRMPFWTESVGGAGAARIRDSSGAEVALRADPLTRQRIAWECGLRSAVVVPIWIGDEAVGSLEFATLELREPDADLLETLRSIGTQIGRVIERERASRALRESERHWQRLAEVAPVGIYRLDPQGVVVYMSERCLEITGLSLEQVRSGDWRDRLPPEAAERFAQARARGVARGEGWGGMLPYAHLDGSVRWALARTEPDRDEAGRLRGFVGTMTDVTERKLAEEELARHRDRLSELVAERTAELERTHERLRESERLAAVGTFAAGIAHQINNPVGTMLLAAQYAEEHLDDRESVAMALHDIVTDALRCRGVVRGVLEFARAEQAEKKPCDLNLVVHRAIDHVAAQAAERDAEIALSLDDALAPVLGSEDALEQVVANLVQNALEAGARRIDVVTANREDCVELEVRDDGRGIPEAQLPRVVMPLFTTRRGSGGTGLGLSLAQGIVCGHGGSLRLASRAGRGTVVTVQLPSALECSRTG